MTFSQQCRLRMAARRSTRSAWHRWLSAPLVTTCRTAVQRSLPHERGAPSVMGWRFARRPRSTPPAPRDRREVANRAWFDGADLPWSACLAAVPDERLEPGREPFGVDEVDEVPVAGPFLDLGV